MKTTRGTRTSTAMSLTIPITISMERKEESTAAPSMDFHMADMVEEVAAAVMVEVAAAAVMVAVIIRKNNSTSNRGFYVSDLIFL